jgi:phytase-like protein
MRLARPWFIVTAAATASAILALAPATRADARPAASPAGVAASRACPPAGLAVSFSDSLDKLVYHGVTLGGLSSLAWDPRSAAWVSAVDNHGADPARIWFFRNLAHPKAGNRIPEVQAYGRDSLLVEEAAFSTTAGNSEELYAVTGVNAAPDVSTVANLSLAPAKDVVSKKLVANLVACPTLGAPSRETQANPLLDNYEGMTIIGGPGLAGVSLISDDNFSATQFTRVLNLLVKLP